MNHRFHEDKIDQLGCADGIDRDIHIWEANNAKGILIAIHGAMAHGGDYGTMAKSFNQKGWHMVSFDMRGHNKQRKVHIRRFEDYLDDLKLFIGWAQRAYPNLPVFIVGHSMGGLVAGLYALYRETPDDTIQGYILSAPYWANAVPLSPVLKWLSGLLAFLTPSLSAPTEDFLDVLTHDAQITARHRQDEADDIRARKVSCRFANELFKAHSLLEQKIDQWQAPLFAVIAGDDRLTDSKAVLKYLDTIPDGLVDSRVYPDNFHENFNETNREEIFDQIEHWLNKQCSSSGQQG